MFSQEHSYESLNRGISLKILLCLITSFFFPTGMRGRSVNFQSLIMEEFLLYSYWYYQITTQMVFVDTALCCWDSEASVDSLISVEVFCLHSLLCIWFCVPACSWKRFFTKNNTIIFQLAVCKVPIKLLTKLILILFDGFQYRFLLLFTPVISTKKEYN